MNHLAPRQRKISKKWDYTQKNDDQVFPVGYCREWKPFDEKIFTKERADLFNEIEKPFLDKYHSHGHDTKEEACKCYETYLLDRAFKVSKPEKPQELHKCEVCGDFTSITVEVGFGCCHVYDLCEKHANREEVEKIFHIAESFQS